jgi:hypothetical protein
MYDGAPFFEYLCSQECDREASVLEEEEELFDALDS